MSAVRTPQRLGCGLWKFPARHRHFIEWMLLKLMDLANCRASGSPVLRAHDDPAHALGDIADAVTGSHRNAFALKIARKKARLDQDICRDRAGLAPTPPRCESAEPGITAYQPPSTPRNLHTVNRRPITSQSRQILRCSRRSLLTPSNAKQQNGAGPLDRRTHDKIGVCRSAPADRMPAL